MKQQLQSLSRAGLTRLPRAKEMPVLADGVADSLPVAVSLPLAVPSATGSEDDQSVRLQACAQRVAACVRCPHLAKTRKQTVFGVGNPHARLMFIGEAPGADEDAQGIPFVGRAGQLLTQIIASSGFTRDEVYICNILRCRPPENRNPLPDEAANCREYLDEQISIVDPEYIVCLGAIAAQNLLNSTETIGRMRKRFYQYGQATVMCTYHPSYLMRSPGMKKETWDDMQMLLKKMGLPIPEWKGKA